MNTPSRSIAVFVAALGMTGLSTGSAAAEAADGTTVPLAAVFRTCSFGPQPFVNATGFGSGQSTISTGGTNTVTADVHFAIGQPNTAYKVRLIQGPRPETQTCVPGDPGVVGAVLNTDGNGTGAVTLSDARRPGATNAWVFVEGPPYPGKIRGDFYTSEILTVLN